MNIEENEHTPGSGFSSHIFDIKIFIKEPLGIIVSG